MLGVSAGAGRPQGGPQGRSGESVVGQGLVLAVVALAFAFAALFVVVDGSVAGGDSGVGEAASVLGVGEAGRAMSAPGRETALPPDSMATDTALPDRGSACDTATAVTTMATLLNATTSTRGDKRRTQRRCTDLTSSPPVWRRGRQHAPDPSRRGSVL